MRRALVGLIAFLIVMAGLIGGIFASAGFVGCIWGPPALQNILGNPPNRGHPAFWVFIVLMVPAMITGGIGALFAIALPLSHQFGVRLRLLDSPSWQGKLGRWYTIKIMDALAFESQAVNT